MNILPSLILGAFVLWFVYGTASFLSSARISMKLVAMAESYSKEGANSRPMLVLGDSTAVGVGASAPQDSLAARAAAHIQASSVENYAKSGAVTSDLLQQIQQAKKEKYSLILVQIGGNDIIRFRSSKSAAAQLSEALNQLPDSDKVVVISAGNVGGAPLFPLFLRPLYTRLNVSYHEAFERAVEAKGFVYVNLYTAPSGNLIENHPEVYLAEDGLHPSTAGYALWFEAIRDELGK